MAYASVISLKDQMAPGLHTQGPLRALQQSASRNSYLQMKYLTVKT